MTVRPMEPGDREAYAEYWCASPQTHFFQRLEWDEVFAKVYGYRPRHLIAVSGDGRVTGIMPLYEVRSLLFGRSVKSMPFHTRGGMSADDIETAGTLFDAALDVTRAVGAGTFDLKHAHLSPWDGKAPCGWRHAVVPYHRYVLDLTGRDEDGLFSSFKQDVRNAVRKAAKNGVRVTIGTAREDLERFHGLSLMVSVESGLPCHPLAFFEALYETFVAKGEGAISLAWLGDTPIAGKLFFMDRHKRTAVQNWSAMLHEHRALKATSLILWEEIRHCLERGMRSFDFGVTNEAHVTSAFFKSRWDTDTRPVFFHQYTRGAARTVRDDHSDFGLARRVWQRLPVPVINLLCRGLMRHLA